MRARLLPVVSTPLVLAARPAIVTVDQEIPVDIASSTS
jgi:hypothetical protein